MERLASLFLSLGIIWQEPQEKVAKVKQEREERKEKEKERKEFVLTCGTKVFAIERIAALVMILFRLKKLGEKQKQVL